ncbi:hypothetical protein PCE1_004208 [Barthelona sp. PCE]
MTKQTIFLLFLLLCVGFVNCSEYQLVKDSVTIQKLPGYTQRGVTVKFHFKSGGIDDSDCTLAEMISVDVTLGAGRLFSFEKCRRENGVAYHTIEFIAEDSGKYYVTIWFDGTAYANWKINVPSDGIWGSIFMLLGVVIIVLGAIVFLHIKGYFHVRPLEKISLINDQVSKRKKDDDLLILNEESAPTQKINNDYEKLA